MASSQQPSAAAIRIESLFFWKKFTSAPLASRSRMLSISPAWAASQSAVTPRVSLSLGLARFERRRPTVAELPAERAAIMSGVRPDQHSRLERVARRP